MKQIFTVHVEGVAFADITLVGDSDDLESVKKEAEKILNTEPLDCIGGEVKNGKAVSCRLATPKEMRCWGQEIEDAAKELGVWKSRDDG